MHTARAAQVTRTQSKGVPGGDGKEATTDSVIHREDRAIVNKGNGIIHTCHGARVLLRVGVALVGVIWSIKSTDWFFLSGGEVGGVSHHHRNYRYFFLWGFPSISTEQNLVRSSTAKFVPHSLKKSEKLGCQHIAADTVGEFLCLCDKRAISWQCSLGQTDWYKQNPQKTVRFREKKAHKDPNADKSKCWNSRVILHTTTSRCETIPSVRFSCRILRRNHHHL